MNYFAARLEWSSFCEAERRAKERERKTDKAAQINLHQRQPHQFVFPEDDGIGWNIARNYTVCSNDTIISNRNPFQNSDIAVNFYIFSNDDRRCVEFIFMPHIFWLCIKGVIVVVEFATFGNASIIAQFNFIKTIN